MDEKPGEEPTEGEDVGWQSVHDSMLSIMRAADEHFGDRQATDAEIRAFIKGRLIAEGKSEAEADDVLRDL